MALWIILYGLVQANAPRLLRARQRGQGALIKDSATWALGLAVVPAVLALVLYLTVSPTSVTTSVLVIGLLLFGAVFAVNSALHSYLILAFTKSERVTMDVGFYYMSNAFGRLLGTVLSGLSYQLGGVWLCLAVASAMLLISALGAHKLRSV